MKLKNLMYATMIACAFASCSKDDDAIDNGQGNANAILDIKLERAETKALPTGTAEVENKINTLSLLVFNGTSDNATLEAIGSAQGDGGAMSVKTPVKPGNKKVIVLANINLIKTSPAIATTMTYADLKAAVVSFKDGEYEGGLTMNSKTYDVTVVASKTNYMGYGDGTNNTDETKTYVAGAAETVKLYRNVAKVLLNSVAVKTGINKDQYPGASIELKEVFVLHGHTKTNVIGANGAEWGAINQTGAYLNGHSNTDYQAWATYMTTPVNGVAKDWVYPFIPTTATPPYALEGSYVQALSGGSFTYNVNTPNLNPFYVYENTEADKTAEKYTTLLVVKADFKYKNVDGAEVVEEGRYYPLSVGYAGTNDFSKIPFKDLRSGTLSGVLRNVQYNVSLTISGPGYETPFGPKPEGPDGPGPGGDTFLDAQVEVVEFGVVDQAGEVE